MDYPMKPRKPSIDLGLAILSATNKGRALPHSMIAAYCDTSKQRIEQIEKAAMKKLRVRFPELEIHLRDLEARRKVDSLPASGIIEQ